MDVMNTPSPRRVAAVLAAAALAVSLTACTSTTPPAPTGGSGESTQTVHLVDVDGNEVPADAVLGWSDDVFASPVASDPTYTKSFPVPAGATAVATFISPRGSETDTSAWNASGWLGLTPEGILLPNLKLSGNTQGGTGTPSSTQAVATTGGDYSVGFAFLDGTTVVEADFIQVTVVGDADPNDATWTRVDAP